MDGPLRHALIIEDDMLIGMDMRSALSEIGFGSFAFASTADQALEQAKLRRPDLVTADIGLLDGTGVEACRVLEAELGPLDIIYVTGSVEEAAGSGRAIVAKPFTPADISAAYLSLRPPSHAA